MRILPLLVVLFLLGVACGSGVDDIPETLTPTARPTGDTTLLASNVAIFTNSAGEQIALEVEIADTPDERSQGLMNREDLAENAGMLFVYDDDHQGGFWMRNTLIPLSIAFVLENGTIIDIQDMEPETTKLHRPDERYRNAIEANQGWFKRKGIAVGDVVAIPSSPGFPVP
ncbi:MAG: DUF192 domain-containing protein [Chloroflexi bacterium]|nr:DUF192 domain-containing protein [Chloroflexota bacterium]